MKTKGISYDEIKSLGTLGRIEISHCAQNYCEKVANMFRMRTASEEEANGCIEMFHQKHDPIIVPKENLLQEVEKIIVMYRN